MNISRNSFKIVKFITKNVLKSVLLSVIAPVKISMMPSAPPTTELPPPAAHQRPKISFSIDSIVSGGVSPNEKKKDSESEEEESKVLSQRSQLESKELKFGNMGKLELLNQFRSMHHPLSSFHHHLQQQLHFNREGGNVVSPAPLGGHHHLRYNFHVPPTPKTQSEKEEEQSVVNNRVSSSPRRSPSVHSSRSPSPAERKSPQSQSPRCSSPEESRSSPASINREGGGGMPHGLNSIHLPPTPGQLGPGPLQPFPGFPPMGAPPGFPGVPGGHPHHPGIPWGAPPNPPHHSVAHPLYPWILARQARLFPPRFGPGAELPAFLFQPFRKPKRIRTAFSPSQLLRLEHAFEKNHYVVGTERKQLAKSLSLSETQVKVWFQNRRTKHKRTEQEEGPGDKPNNSDISLCGSNLSSSATSADSSTRHFSEEMSEDEEEICMDDEYSEEEEMLHSNYHHHPNNSKQGV